ncbi:YqiA/YcfP family alpha/beta fold hydrolase [Aliiglaciecola sp. 3_MG-2023]|uniref:YqiA/YcfP family alpha/beta fold hydrolase n=1 Tax=Aliiglaciecola sp. 3_MG-2023 TaxID=3062644 RepID=UPI0026E1ECD4|nr:YqiA/YcfP family alpha/beta fold hydrolase [Aliiglaciecola sp. 3_MG-2023]MDO6694476.1 YqiA/YcfP family alpha/beta fold hydrolase [Aliiglaciecola sp. 3_MG-2023]
MRVIFSHGKESGPWGSKIRKLAEVAKHHGYTVDSIDYSGIMNADVRVDKLIKVLSDIKEPVLLVGSSMGGYVSMVAAQNQLCSGLFLLAPALFMPGYINQTYAPNTEHICIVHGLNDEVIPYQHSQKYAEISGCELHLIQGDHRLNTSMPEVTDIFQTFLKQYQ